MFYTADLHIHSRYANATSPSLDVQTIAAEAQRKGVQVIGTGDITHPAWQQTLAQELLFDDATGMYRVRSSPDAVLFTPTGEVSLVYKDGGHFKRMHMLFLLPDLSTAQELSKQLAAYGDLSVDGRPLLHMSAREFVLCVLQLCPRAEVIPAHIWTPWYGIMAKRFGYDRLEDAFGEAFPSIHAIETGLDSNPLMNWIGLRHDYTILSFSDAHSLPRIGREATIFEGEATYTNLLEGIRMNKVAYSINYFPELGKYFYSGHRKCHFSVDPREDLQLKGICPVCHRKLVQGVDRRVLDVALLHHSLAEIEFIERSLCIDEHGFRHFDAKKPYISLIPLDQLIAAALHIKSEQSKHVQTLYHEILKEFGPEIPLLLNPPQGVYHRYPEIAKAIESVLHLSLTMIPGYDNTYGTFFVS